MGMNTELELIRAEDSRDPLEHPLFKRGVTEWCSFISVFFNVRNTLYMNRNVLSLAVY